MVSDAVTRSDLKTFRFNVVEIAPQHNVSDTNWKTRSCHGYVAVTTTQNLKAIVREDIEQVWKEGELSFVDGHYLNDYVLHVTYQSEEIHSQEG